MMDGEDGDDDYDDTYDNEEVAHRYIFMSGMYLRKYLSLLHQLGNY